MACPCERPSIGRRVWQEKARTAILGRRVYSLAGGHTFAESSLTSDGSFARAFHKLAGVEGGFGWGQSEQVHKAEQRPQTVATFRLTAPSDGFET